MEGNNISQPQYSVSHEFSINISEKNKNIINETENDETNIYKGFYKNYFICLY